MIKTTDQFETIYLSNNLSSYDPYDIWKTGIGLKVKNLFNKSRVLGGLPALTLALADQLMNATLRRFYKKQEYPVVRALAAQVLLNKYVKTKDKSFLADAKKHLDWLRANVSAGYSGACWGLGFKWPAASDIVYDANTPFATHTPYALEALHRYTQLSGDNSFVDLIKSCFQFYEKDLYVMYEDEKMMATSYGPFKDRIVTNSVSYVMFSYSIFLTYFPELKQHIESKILKLYTFIKFHQLPDGSWMYAPYAENSFIDCFHSCFVIKNVLKTRKQIDLPGSEEVAEKGYAYICNHFFDKKAGLFKRFTIANKLSLTKFDLYDNAEMLNLARMMKDRETINHLSPAIKKNFISGNDIYSAIGLFKKKRNKNYFRWAVMPYLYALSTLD